MEVRKIKKSYGRKQVLLDVSFKGIVWYSNFTGADFRLGIRLDLKIYTSNWNIIITKGGFDDI